MLTFTHEEFTALRRYPAQFKLWLNHNIAEPLQKHIAGPRPRQLDELYKACAEFSDVASQTRGTGDPVAPTFTVSRSHARLLKRMILTVRRETAARQEAKMVKTSDPEMLEYLKGPVAELDLLMEQPWFHETVPLRLPRLTEFLALEFAEEVYLNTPQKVQRKFEDKMHILYSQSIFLDDLRYYRCKCELRAKPVLVAFLDIDDFKQLNDRYGETIVDRDFLSKFMEELEAHIFSHGYAYRFGGDEYVLLLPNMSIEWGAKFLGAFQARLFKVEYLGIEEKPTVSIGVCYADQDCFLTDREILERANRAEKFAKRTKKGGIAGYKGALYREEDLCAIRQMLPEPATQ